MEAKKYKLGHHLVAFLDVLGQREKFRRLLVPKNPDEEAQVTEVLRQTAGFVVDLRRVFQTQFEVFEKGAAMGAHTKESLRPNFVGFSDSFVTSVPLRNDGGDLVRIVTIFSALSAAAIVMLTSLANKHPLRGGIDVGLATEIGPGETYGTALERAYLLECKVAQYPRIVIGDELWKYLNSVLSEFERLDTPVAKAITAITQRIMRLIANDTDGKRILDYLGSAVVEHSAPGHKEHMVQPAYEFVLTEQKRLIVEGNAELIERYASLRRYFETRLSLWEIPAVKSSV
jgi:hypothetical protein